MNCLVCKAKCSKYKCPTCNLPYCTMECWKVHRSQKCQKPQKGEEKLASTLERYKFKTEDTVPLEKLKLLEQSDGVRSTLHNPHVRNILDLIDKSEKPSYTLKAAMLEPIFVDFVEECLKIVEPAAEEPSGCEP